MTTVIAWIVMGLVAGWLGKKIMPGEDPGGLLVQLALGVGGAFLGGGSVEAVDWRNNGDGWFFARSR